MSWHYDYKKHEEREMAKQVGSRPGYASTAALNAGLSRPPPTAAPASGRKRHVDEDEYLEDIEESTDGADYQPAPGSPGPDKDASDEEDPLDAFMAGIEVQAKKDKDRSSKSAAAASTSKEEAESSSAQAKAGLGRTDIDGEDDMQESYFKFLEQRALEAGPEEEDDILDYDDDGNPVMRKRTMELLPAVDHAAEDYAAFQRSFYAPHPDIAALDDAQVAALRHTLGLTVSGLEVPKPVGSFAHFGFDDALMGAIRRQEFAQPTPIQAQAIPAALSGRDVVGIAKTGSGKTAAYVWPALVHLMDQPELRPGDGPIALIAVPTRELAIQVYNEARKFGKVYNVNVVCAYGGGSKWEQTKALQEGCEVVVCTPGRMIDLVKAGATNLRRVTFLVFDEADKMFALGFEAQVRSLAERVRPDRQTLMFSATFKKRVEKLARDVLSDPVRIVQGQLGEANADIEQRVAVLTTAGAKWPWLTERLVHFAAEGKVLIFVTRKTNAAELADSLKGRDLAPLLLTGDVHQSERNAVIQSFRKDKAQKILVATDVAARGLDIPEIRTVVNFDVARDLDTHLHRVGRTGRAGQKGTAWTLVTEADKEFAGHLVRNLESVSQPVPPALLDLANKSQWFPASRASAGGGSVPRRIGGAGLGFKARPGLGSGGGGGDEAARPSGSVAMGTAGADPLALRSPAGASRVSTMKAAFSSSFERKFRAASEATAWRSAAPPPPAKRRSRWD